MLTGSVPHLAVSDLPARAARELPPAVASLIERLMAAADAEVTIPSGTSVRLADVATPELLPVDHTSHAAAWSTLPQTDAEPAPVAVLAMRELWVEPGARLRIDGAPTILCV